MRNLLGRIGIVSMVTLACAKTGDPASHGNAALGIASYKLDETTSHLSLIALDARNQQVADVEVTRGPFTMSEAFAAGRAGAERNVVGRVIAITYGELRTYHESEGPAQLVLQIPPGAEYDDFAAFVDDRYVRSVLDRWKISFSPHQRATLSGETPYGIQYNCSPLGYSASVSGAGVDCTQMYGGGSTNTCSSLGSNSDACGTLYVNDDGGYSYNETLELQCCHFPSGDGPSVKRCRPTPGSDYECTSKNGLVHVDTGFGCAGDAGCAMGNQWNRDYSYCGISLSGNCLTMSWYYPDGHSCSDGSDCVGGICDQWNQCCSEQPCYNCQYFDDASCSCQGTPCN